MLKVCLAGRIAEEIFCNDVTSGAQNDIAQATEMVKKMILDWGMNEKLGMINYHNDDNSIMPMELLGRDFSERTAEIVDQEIRAAIDQAYTDTKELIETNRDAVDRLAQALLKYETLDAADVKLIIDGKVLDKPTVGDFIEAEAAKAGQGDESKVFDADAGIDTDNDNDTPKAPPIIEA